MGDPTWNLAIKINDFDTTITDWLITVACGWFVYRLCCRPMSSHFVSHGRATWRAAMICMYISIGASSFFGGIAHGFFTTDENEWTGSPGQVIAWKLSMIFLNIGSLGTSCLALELIGEFFPSLFDWGSNPLLVYLTNESSSMNDGVSQLYNKSTQVKDRKELQTNKTTTKNQKMSFWRRLLLIGTLQLKANLLTFFVVQLLVSIVLIVFFNDSFIVSAFGSLSSGVFVAGVVIAMNGCRRPTLISLILLLGVCLQFIAIGVQIRKISFHPIYFQHNATFHVIQLIGILVFYYGMVTYVTRIAHIEVAQRKLLNDLQGDDFKASAQYSKLSQDARSLGRFRSIRRIPQVKLADLFKGSEPLDNDCPTPTTPLQTSF